MAGRPIDKRTTGAWIIHHTAKLKQVQNTGPYERIENAGRAGILLAALAEDLTVEVERTRVQALAQANGITIRETPFLLQLLQDRKLIDVDDDRVEVLGVTVDAVLEHTADILEDQQPGEEERATISLAEGVSKLPLSHKEAVEMLGDDAGISNPEELLREVTDIGFVDSEEAKQERLYFNGNLFRRDAVHKAEGVLSTLTAAERNAIQIVDQMVGQSGCISFVDLNRVLGADLFAKLGPLGFYDVHEVKNEQGSTYFVTKPAAFCKFSTSGHADAFVDDALDMAKALVACLAFGMTHRSYSEGKITQIGALLRKLVSGAEVGPATAIGRDYQALEQRGVVKIRLAYGSRFYMKLLKADVGRLALNVLTQGDTSHEFLPQFPGVAVTGYSAPEVAREINRRRSNSTNKMHAHKILHTLRTGGRR